MIVLFAVEIYRLVKVLLYSYKHPFIQIIQHIHKQVNTKNRIQKDTAF